MVGVSLVCTLYHCMNVIFHNNCYSLICYSFLFLGIS